MVPTVLKVAESGIVFSEIPDEITLAIGISNCPFRCQKCSSPYLRENIGADLTFDLLDTLIDKNKGITCVDFSGGDIDYQYVKALAEHVHSKYPTLKTAFYSGNDTSYPLLWESDALDYYKIGHWDYLKGPLDVKTTNQKLYKRMGDKWVDITSRFLEKKNNVL
jgi:anaerobic ribonucleoside-triphosphate reductase activating protein